MPAPGRPTIGRDLSSSAFYRRSPRFLTGSCRHRDFQSDRRPVGSNALRSVWHIRTARPAHRGKRMRQMVDQRPEKLSSLATLAHGRPIQRVRAQSGMFSSTAYPAHRCAGFFRHRAKALRSVTMNSYLPEAGSTRNFGSRACRRSRWPSPVMAGGLPQLAQWRVTPSPSVRRHVRLGR